MNSNQYDFFVYYLTIGVLLNWAYDLLISRAQKEELRFTMIERIMFAILWPIYTSIIVFKFIYYLFKGEDND